MKTLRKLLNRIIKNYWRPVRCGWPYPEGWACWNEHTRTSLDHGQKTKTKAQYLCNELNKYHLK